MSNYYKDLWTKENADGTEFFKKVRFDVFSYKHQEKIFREYIKQFKGGDVRHVLELGAGTGRMTKIMLQELPYYRELVNQMNLLQTYDCIEVDAEHYIDRARKHMGDDFFKTSWLNLDITSKEFEIWSVGHRYDLILASEVFMHIKPEDIENVIKILRNITTDIVNIDWNFDYAKSNWCFIHDYEKLYESVGARKVNIIDMKNIQQSLFHYRFN